MGDTLSPMQLSELAGADSEAGPLTAGAAGEWA
jgi:hypothetical protein